MSHLCNAPPSEVLSRLSSSDLWPCPSPNYPFDNSTTSVISPPPCPCGYTFRSRDHVSIMIGILCAVSFVIKTDNQAVRSRDDQRRWVRENFSLFILVTFVSMEPLLRLDCITTQSRSSRAWHSLAEVIPAISSVWLSIFEHAHSTELRLIIDCSQTKFTGLNPTLRRQLFRYSIVIVNVMSEGYAPRLNRAAEG